MIIKYKWGLGIGDWGLGKLIKYNKIIFSNKYKFNIFKN